MDEPKASGNPRSCDLHIVPPPVEEPPVFRRRSSLLDRLAVGSACRSHRPRSRDLSRRERKGLEKANPESLEARRVRVRAERSSRKRRLWARGPRMRVMKREVKMFFRTASPEEIQERVTAAWATLGEMARMVFGVDPNG